jgi:hypothetical protein
MRDVRGALENITPHTERVAGDLEDGRRIGIRHRLYWLISEKEKLENREKELNIAHGSLGAVLDYLAPMEPIEEPQRPKEAHKKETHIDIDIKREGPHHHTTERVEREVLIERDAAPRRVEEREVYIEREHQGPPHYEERRDVRYDDRGNHFEERDIHIERTRESREPPRYEAQYNERYEERDTYERRPQYPEERRPFPEPLGRRPESYEDPLPERDSWMQSEARRPRGNAQYGPYGEYAEYGAPQPSGAAHYQRRFKGDAGFGDEEILNPQPVPLSKEYQEREVSGFGYPNNRGYRSRL